jgi:hypothetical protein
MSLERSLYDLDRPYHAGTEAARLRQDDFHDPGPRTRLPPIGVISSSTGDAVKMPRRRSPVTICGNRLRTLAPRPDGLNLSK